MTLFGGMAFLGAIMIGLGVAGLRTYARFFQEDPHAVLSADLLLAMLKGPGCVPVSMCAFAVLGGIWFVAVPIYVGVEIGFSWLLG